MSPEKAGKNWPPKTFHIMIKPRGAICNLSCDYCFYLPKIDLYRGSKFRMSYEVLESFIKQYINAQRGSTITFGWQGGEPTLMGLEFFKKAVELQEKYNTRGLKIINAFQTNGTLLTDEWGKFFRDNNFLIGISIDGPPSLHDHFRKDKHGNPTFKLVRKGLNVLIRNKVEFNILACVNSENSKYPLKVYRYLKNVLKAKFIQFIPIVEKVKGNKRNGKILVSSRSVTGKLYGAFMIKIFDEWVRNDVGKVFVQMFDMALNSWMGNPVGGLCIFNKTCGDALALEHNGDLYACDHFVVPSELRGNILETPLIDLVSSDEQYHFGLKKWKDLPRFCRACDVLSACNGGCPKNRIIKTPDGEHGLNFLCEGYKAFFHYVDPYMRFMANELQHHRPASNIMKYLKNRG
ncbi:MAG: anaerobic sulfatase maturase [Promethearchaeota archaeon]